LIAGASENVDWAHPVNPPAAGVDNDIMKSLALPEGRSA
jgi:hypothetical protein